MNICMHPVGCYGSSHHIPDLPPLIEHEDQQQYNLENDNVFDKDVST